MKAFIISIVLFVMVLTGCKAPENGGGELFDKDNLVAWCIVPFDAEERAPEQRAVMLNELGIEFID